MNTEVKETKKIGAKQVQVKKAGDKGGRPRKQPPTS